MALNTKNLADRLRMRTALLVPLLIAFFAWTTASLLLVRVIIQQETRKQLADDLRSSRAGYQHVQEQHRATVAHQAALMAQLPTIKALMSSNDASTIRDAGQDFWQSSGSDLFVLLASDGTVAAAFRREGALASDELAREIRFYLRQGSESFYLPVAGTLYEVAVRPLTFGPPSSGSVLGYLAIGFAVNDSVANDVAEATASQVAFLSQGHVLSSTMDSAARRELEATLQRSQGAVTDQPLRIAGEDYLATLVSLGPPGLSTRSPQLIVLKSFAQERRLLMRVNRWIVALSIAALLGASLLVLSISRSITRPLAALMEGTRALGRGDFAYALPSEGAEEVRELSQAFAGMREQIQRSQRELVQTERLATIGRMASSISHDLRHYLSAIYANAEFLSDSKLPQAERDELFEDVRVAVMGMTDMLDSLLLFTQTGSALRKSSESMAVLLQRSVSMLRAHPAARDVILSVEGLSSARANVDAVKLGRAVYNLLLNGCQAARLGPRAPEVRLTLAEDESYLRIHVADNGPGVAPSVERTMFQPFVSDGRQSGTGLGLTLADQVATEHGGYIHHFRTEDGWTLFTIVLPREEPDADSAEAIRPALEEVR